MITNFPIDQLKPSFFRKSIADNSKLKVSMQEHNQLYPCKIKADGTIIDGNRRYACAKELGWKYLSVEIID